MSLLLVPVGGVITAFASSPSDTPAAPPATPATQASQTPELKVNYTGGQLTIKARNFTLGEVLNKVSSLVGMKLDVPSGVNGDKLPYVDVGPGPAREVLAQLLSDTKFDYLIQDSETNPEKIDNLMLMTRDTKGKSSDNMPRPQYSNYSRSGTQEAEERIPAPEVVPAVGPETGVTAATPGPVDSSPPVDPISTTPAAIDPLIPSSLQPAQTSQPRPGALSPPDTLTPQSMNQQLQQMYQQRMQLNQQVNPQANQQPGQSAPPKN